METCSTCLVQSRRNTKAAKRFFRKLLKGLCYAPRVIVTDKLGSYGAAKREILPGVEHRQSRYLNNRCEVSHQPTRRRERHMRRFKSARHAQQFLATHTPIHNHFQLRRHRLSASEYRAARDRAFAHLARCDRCCPRGLMCTRVTAAPAAALPLRRQVDSTVWEQILFQPQKKVHSSQAALHSQTRWGKSHATLAGV